MSSVQKMWIFLWLGELTAFLINLDSMRSILYKGICLHSPLLYEGVGVGFDSQQIYSFLFMNIFIFIHKHCFSYSQQLSFLLESCHLGSTEKDYKRKQLSLFLMITVTFIHNNCHFIYNNYYLHIRSLLRIFYNFYRLLRWFRIIVTFI